ncbi:double-stranded DNA-binding domain-containing protein [Blyttiomyces helicus]|uniref:Double-stranded DNA-binding domain-containing protein n=1 Tax=Blyttiomyces helicus TaxID=388810 RepID=A0A4P9W7D3_9FUNG|nr:double-stranded DNA-binding domain-containing protein [Blyttiomyces helicus]|eukprot:RKO86066.1 double-stranded DNA-binding domain-containing protein [Blyttiomyces helicus]
MEDSELAAIRARRMAEMRSTQAGGPARGPSAQAMGLPGSPAGGAEDAEKRSQMEEMRRAMLIQILDNEARERLARIKIVKAEKARGVEDLLIRMAQTGQLRGKVNEPQLIDLLGQIAEQSETKTKITVRYIFTGDGSPPPLPPVLRSSPFPSSPSS